MLDDMYLWKACYNMYGDTHMSNNRVYIVETKLSL